MDDMIALRTFGGEKPTLPPHLLPENAAQQADFCDFTHGHLAPLRDGLLLATMVASVKTIYTEDGLLFYTWPTDTYALQSPVAKDPYERVYFLQGGVFKVTTRAGMSLFGGVPALSYTAGVPRPTVAPGLALVDLTEFPDYPGATLSVSAWWEDGSIRYQEAAAALTQVTRLREYTFTMPARVAGTPATAVARITLKAADAAGKAFMTVTIDPGDANARSTALPGNVTFTLAETAALNFKLSLDYGIAETRAYLYTAKNNWLEESPPSPAATISTTYLQSVVVTLTAVNFTGYRALAGYRLYRTMGANAAYLQVSEGVALSFTDTSHKAADILGSLETLEYANPPATMDVMISLVGGSFAGFSGNTLYISEPYRPHSWQYQVSFRKLIRGICAAPQSIVVTTADGCYLVMGGHPSALQTIQLPVPQAGIAQRSMVNLDGITAFASHDGFVSVTGSQASLRASQTLFARDDWQARYGAILADASIRFAWHDGRLVATSATQALGFLLALDGEETGQYTRFNVRMDSMFQLPVADTLYYSVGANVYQFRGGAAYNYTWWSRDFILKRERNLGVGYIRCSGPVTVTLYVDGQSWYSVTLAGTGYFRLPGGRLGLRWSVKLVGAATVEELYIAGTMRELQRV